MYLKCDFYFRKFRHYFTQNDNPIVTCLIVTVLLPNHLTLSQGNIHILSFILLDDSLCSCYHFTNQSRTLFSALTSVSSSPSSGSSR